VSGLDWDQVLRVLTLQDHNTRVVVVGTMLLGLAAGVLGTYMVLRRRALVGDAVSHATLPGIGLAFIVMVHFGGTGKYLPGLLLGALITGVLGVGAILLIKGTTRIKEDAALGIVLSVFFGFGITLLGVIQKMPTGNQAGLESFVVGKTASMLQADAQLIAVAAVVVLIVCVLLYKEFAILSFDAAFARSQGWPVLRLDAIMMGLVTGVTVIGLQAVGLILIIAMLIIPAAAARFWTDHLRSMLIVAGGIGATSGLLGAGLSGMIPRLPAGAIIVVVAAGLFVISLLFGTRRGMLVRVIEYARLRRTVARQHLLRAIYEWLETRHAVGGAVEGGVGGERRSAIPRAALLAARSWSPAGLARAIRQSRRAGLVDSSRRGPVRVTDDGLAEAARVVGNHRLWEMYLITHADVAPSHVDRGADEIEHVLGPAMVRELETLLAADGLAVPPSPHVLAVSAGSAAPR